MIPQQNERCSKAMKPVKAWDGAAMAGSILCALHCFIQPLLLTSIPMLGLAMGSLAFEVGSLTLTLLISFYALMSGYQLHRRRLPLAAALLSAIILMGSTLLPSDHSHDEHGSLAVWGGCLILVLTHLANSRLMEASLSRTWLQPQEVSPKNVG